MTATIREAGPDILPRYSEIPIAFRVESVLQVESIGAGLWGLRLVEEPVEPYVKDYDSVPGHEEPPTRWASRWDLGNWAFIVAEEAGELLGGATVAWNTEGVDMLEGRTDLACLWDLRVRPEHRRRGIGARLLQRAVKWARAKGCRQLKIETQNINVAACRFYASQGAKLGVIDRHGYAGCPPVEHEAMLVWYLEL